MLCGDPKARLELHSEDYSEPFLFEPPAGYWLCIACHRNNLHKRFADPLRWQVFLAHIRRGGYASDLRQPAIRSQLAEFTTALREGRHKSLSALRPWMARDCWWEALSLDASSKMDKAYRPRP